MTSKKVAAAFIVAIVFAAGLGAGRLSVSGQAQGPLPKITELMRQALGDIEGYEVRVVGLDFPPSSTSPAHQHPGHVFVHVVQGSITTKVGDTPVATYKAGDTFYEPPNAVHAMADNVSATEPARAIAFFVIESGKPSTTMVHQ